MSKKIALFGGVYSNYIALEETIKDAKKNGVDEIYCLGDLGAFGPSPTKVFRILVDNKIPVVQGNYDHSIGNGLDDCACGYTDPRDNYYAKLSYNYTFKNSSQEFKQWMKEFHTEIRITLGPYNVLLAHGSPRRTNEFLWESTTPTHFLEKLCNEFNADIICVTHTGIHWNRILNNGKHFVNVGVIGRPENDGTPDVGYTIIELTNENKIEVKYISVEYDYKKLAAEMKEENLPEEFIETILTGWWTTCLEIMPAKERIRGKY